MHVGTRWIKEIELQIKSSQFFVVLLSKDSILSDMVRCEVELPHTLATNNKLVILPVRIALSALPYDLAAYLNPIQYTVLGLGESYEPVCNQIIAAIEHFTALPEQATDAEMGWLPDQIRALADLTDAIAAPPPTADPRLETGAMSPSSPFYMARAADAIAVRELGRGGTTVIIKGPRQSGKSSLLARICSSARRNNQRLCYVDFQLMDDAQLNSLRTLLRCLAWKIARFFRTSVKPEPWDETLGDKEVLTGFIEDSVLGDGEPAIFIFDEVDRVFDYPCRDDFFALIRAWHNRRATQNNWERVDIVLAHSTDPSLWIQDVNQSPFNVGERVQLEDFDADQIAALSHRHRLRLSRDRDIVKLMTLVGGQPYLIRQALYTMATRQWPVSTLNDVAIEERGPFGDHLRQFRWKLHRNERLRVAIAQILQRGACHDDRDFQKLKAAGLVRGESCHSGQMRYELYDRYFRTQL
jgi:hypothetical protein